METLFYPQMVAVLRSTDLMAVFVSLSVINYKWDFGKAIQSIKNYLSEVVKPYVISNEFNTTQPSEEASSISTAKNFRHSFWV